MKLFILLETAEGLMQLDPVRSYPRRASDIVAQLANVPHWRLDLHDGHVQTSDPPPPMDIQSVALPLRLGRDALGTLHLFPLGGPSSLVGDELRLARWGTRLLARGMMYAERLTSTGGRRSGEKVEDTLKRAPLTPRERDVVALLVSGSSTREIASRTGLTVSTVNTYLKRIFSKLGVHSRVELVARMAGTDALASSEAESLGFADASLEDEEGLGTASEEAVGQTPPEVESSMAVEAEPFSSV
ncbi:MAG: LuxR C-terminal-related transcriptional regulator [Myxococcota bacterium]